MIRVAVVDDHAIVRTGLAQLLSTADDIELVGMAEDGQASLDLLAATEVDIETMVGPADVRTTLAAAIEANVGLIASVSSQTREKISTEVFQGLRERKSARDVAKGIREKVDMGRRRALNIASDQLVKIGAELNDEHRREAGIDTWEWLSSHKQHFRPEHAARDHNRYTDGDAPTDLPGRLPFCGCTSRAVLSLDTDGF